ncbi:MAG: hypothetical protein L3K09_05300 [Thermoplasmata archaeon]|nr:hypothetical protein [Thermoplasmata archaeon]
MFGSHNTYNLTVAGSSHTVNTFFIGETTPTGGCPYTNLSNTDSFNIAGAGSSNLQNLTWYNSVGYSSGYGLTKMPGGGNSNHVGWQNLSSSIACAWTKLLTQSYFLQSFEGLKVHLATHYTPPADVAYDHGAVILEQTGGASTIVDPPAITYAKTAAGLTAQLVLVNLIGSIATQSGTETASLSVQVVSIQDLNLSTNASSEFFVPPMILNLSTPYPGAWSTFIAGAPTLFSAGSSCYSPVTISAPYSCLNPPPGVLVYLRAPLAAVKIRLIVANVALTLS